MGEHNEHPDVIWDGSDEPMAADNVVSKPARAELPEEDLSEDEAVPIYQPGESVDESQLMLTPEKRQEILGKLAEFEYQLSALAPMQQGFVLAMLEDPTSQLEAARKAGYSENGASQRASILMNDARIQAVLALGQQLRQDRTMVTTDRTLNELAIIAFSNIGDYEIRPGSNQVVTREGIPEYALRAVSSAEYTTTVSESGDRVTTTYKAKIKLWSKTDALRMLAMYQKLVGGDGNVDNSKHLHLHKHEHQTWDIGGKRLTF